MIEINFIQSKKTVIKKKQWLFMGLIAVWLVIVINFFVTYIAKLHDHQLLMNKQQLKNVVLSQSSKSELKLQGVLIDYQARWALMSGQNSTVKRVKIGDKVSKDLAVVTKIMPRFIELSLINGQHIKIYLP